MTTREFLLAVLAGLAASECTGLVPWLAARLVAWAVHRHYRDPERARVRAEELQAVLADRPTNLLKLATAAGFAAAAIVVLTGRRAHSLTTVVRRFLRVALRPLRSALESRHVVVGTVGTGIGTVGALIGIAGSAGPLVVGGDINVVIVVVGVSGIGGGVGMVVSGVAVDVAAHAMNIVGLRHGTGGAEQDDR